MRTEYCGAAKSFIVMEDAQRTLALEGCARFFYALVEYDQSWSARKVNIFVN